MTFKDHVELFREFISEKYTSPDVSTYDAFTLKYIKLFQERDFEIRKQSLKTQEDLRYIAATYGLEVKKLDKYLSGQIPVKEHQEKGVRDIRSRCKIFEQFMYDYFLEEWETVYEHEETFTIVPEELAIILSKPINSEDAVTVSFKEYFHWRNDMTEIFKQWYDTMLIASEKIKTLFETRYKIHTDEDKSDTIESNPELC